MPSKKQILARASAACGVTSLLEWMPKSPSLLILNYHRIGNAENTPYDSGVFSCSASEFDWQIGYLCRHYPVLSLEEACRFVHGERVLDTASLLITFDDGYRDNYDLALPVLQKHNAPAAFFLPTAFIGTGKLPWWDIIAFIAKQSEHDQITFRYPEVVTFDLTAPHQSQSIMQMLRLFKSPAVEDQEEFLCQLESACGTARPDQAADRCFMTWDEARAMQSAGMSFGSHTHTHQVLAKLAYTEQLEELGISREIMQSELGGIVDTLAYPVGAITSFSDETRKALNDADYRTALSFRGGINLLGQMDPLDVRRNPSDTQDRALMRLRTSTLALSHRNLI